MTHNRLRLLHCMPIVARLVVHGCCRWFFLCCLSVKHAQDHLCFRHAGFCTMLCSRHQANCLTHQGYEAHTVGMPVTASKLCELLNVSVPDGQYSVFLSVTDSIYLY